MPRRTDLLNLGASALVLSALVRVAMPPSFNPENPLQVVADFVASVALGFGLLAVAASLVALVLGEAGGAERPPATLPISSRHLLPASAGLLAASLALRLAFRVGPPEPHGRVVALAGHVELTLLALGLVCLAALLLRLALTDGAARLSSR